MSCDPEVVPVLANGEKKEAMTRPPSNTYAEPAMIDVPDASVVLATFTPAVIWSYPISNPGGYNH
jgi:hypothetical protein